MGRLYVLLLFICYSTSSFAQSMQGIVVDENADPVSYANIGIEGYPNGTLSDASGRFELLLPDSLNRDLNVSFSHLSYVTAEITIAELQRLDSSGERIEITMPSRAFDIEKVVVRPSATKHRYVKRGFPVPGHAIFTLLGEEIGSKLNVESRVRVSKIKFTVLSNTYDELKLRVNVYKVGSQTTLPENILRSPIYCNILPNKKKQKIDVVPIEDVVLTGGEYLFTLEFVEHKGEGEVRFPMFLSKSFTRPSSMEGFEELPANVGISVEGVEIAEE